MGIKLEPLALRFGRQPLHQPFQLLERLLGGTFALLKCLKYHFSTLADLDQIGLLLALLQCRFAQSPHQIHYFGNNCSWLKLRRALSRRIMEASVSFSIQ